MPLLCQDSFTYLEFPILESFSWTEEPLILHLSERYGERPGEGLEPGRSEGPVEGEGVIYWLWLAPGKVAAAEAIPGEQGR